MALDLYTFVRLRPRLFHLTAECNVDRIRRTGALFPASTLLASAGMNRNIRRRRPASIVVRDNGDRIHIRDQAPLHAGNIEFIDGWTFEDMVQHLNDHVFFWPGAEQPNDYGRRHFTRYADQDCRVLVANTAAVLACNPNLAPRFCRFNSGSPRCTAGKRSPRGPNLFQVIDDYKGTAGTVVETVFRGEVRLPEKLEIYDASELL